MCAYINHPQVLPGTDALEGSFDPAIRLLSELDQFLDQALETAKRERNQAINQGINQATAYDPAILAQRRQELARLIGVVDPRLPIDTLAVIATTKTPSCIARTDSYEVHQIRWPVLEGVDGEGLWVKPVKDPIATVVAIPDADWTPAGVCGLDDTVAAHAQFARRFAELRCEVFVPVVIDRKCTWSGNPEVKMTNQPHREFIYRMAFQMGRHIIGYEVQKVLSLVDYLSVHRQGIPILVYGYGEGGLLALHSGALDERIAGVGVSGYFGNRFQVYEEPIYRNIWRQLQGFSDAELAGLIAPRTLIVEAASAPDVGGPPSGDPKRKGAAPGRITTPNLQEVRQEIKLAATYFSHGQAGNKLRLIEPDAKDPGPGCQEALTGFLSACGLRLEPRLDAHSTLSVVLSSGDGENGCHYDFARDHEAQMYRQFNQLRQYTQKLWHRSAKVREKYWSEADLTSVPAWKRSIEPYRRALWEEVIGRCPPADQPAAARSRQIEEHEDYAIYDVTIDVWQDVSAFAYLVIPEGMAPNERRPVVVCQHGLGGDPAVILKEGTYKSLGRRLASLGYIVLIPQSPFIGPAGDRFRNLQRKANALGWSLFSFFTQIHEQWLNWLETLPFVDPERIGFYGLSYGGKTAMRVPALLPRYALSICSGDYNEWIMKTVSDDFFSSYMFTGEWEVFEFNLGHTFNYAEMTYLIAPRPFMVERGTRDACSSDEWVAFEYAKAHRLYLRLGIDDRIELEIFDGGHEINFCRAKEFLNTHLGWR